MIDPEHKETMQISNEASLVCLKTWPSQNGPQETRNATEGFVELQDEMDAHAGDINDIDKLFSREGSAPVNQYYSRPFYNQQSFAWTNFHSDAQVLRQNQFNIRENQFHSMNGEYNFCIENRIQYLPLKMFSQGYPTEVQFQEFQYFVVIDFEATCDKEKNPYPQEIIEFPSVLVNSLTGRLEAFFQTYVRPAYHQHLTDFCKELTGIQQFQVDGGVPLSEALFMHDKWLEEKGIKHKNFAIVTWSNWDCRVMLESECRLKRIRKPPYFNRWINLKVPFQEVFGNVRCNLKEAVQKAGLAWEGRQHCGLDDACNTARLLAYLMRRGFRFSITNSLSWHSSEDQPGDQPQKPKLLMGRALQFHSPINHTSGMGRGIYCFCGVKSSKCMVRKPGPTQGRWFFGCGNWTASRRAVCDYFMWASP